MTTLIENNAEVFALGPVEVNFKGENATKQGFKGDLCFKTYLWEAVTTVLR